MPDPRPAGQIGLAGPGPTLSTRVRETVTAAGRLARSTRHLGPAAAVISNVPVASRRLYLNGCELTDFYPVSVV